MDFGHLAENQLETVHFQLPEDSELTKQVLHYSKRVEVPQVYLGCAKWGRKEWKGMLYPEKTPEAAFLDEYVKHFNSIELNAVFYGMPKKEQVRNWADKAAASGSEFKFCLKFTRSITHLKRLKNAEEETSAYLDAITGFGPYLGPCFLQLSDNFGPKNFEILKDYLEKLPRDLKVFVEVRHKDWFEDAEARKELFAMLHELEKGAVITDAAGRRDCVHMELPTPEAFIRFVGNGLHPTDYSRIDEWSSRIRKWMENGLQSLYFFLHQHDEKNTPLLAAYTIEKLNQISGISLKVPAVKT